MEKAITDKMIGQFKDAAKASEKEVVCMADGKEVSRYALNNMYAPGYNPPSAWMQECLAKAGAGVTFQADRPAETQGENLIFIVTKIEKTHEGELFPSSWLEESHTKAEEAVLKEFANDMKERDLDAESEILYETDYDHWLWEWSGSEIHYYIFQAKRS